MTCPRCGLEVSAFAFLSRRGIYRTNGCACGFPEPARLTEDIPAPSPDRFPPDMEADYRRWLEGKCGRRGVADNRLMDIGELFRQMRVAGVRDVEVTQELRAEIDAYIARNELGCRELYGISFHEGVPRERLPKIACVVVGCGFVGTPEETYGHIEDLSAHPSPFTLDWTRMAK